MQQRRAGLLPIGTKAHAPVEKRFWRFVNKTDNCWIWTGKGTKKGYGQIASGGKDGVSILAHRLSYEIHKGPIPDGLVVMHSCDNPSCVNPDHLSAGTQSENIKDSIRKGRKVLPKLPVFIGVEHHMAKINEDIVRMIRASKKTKKELAEELGLAYSTVRRIKAGLLWKHIT
jgi:hypothetical protein